jgi:hypothetical protein
MKKKHVILIAITAVLIVLSIMTSLLKSISGTVVDAETGKPVEGAVVLVEWTRRVGIGDYHTVSVRAAETITDKEGKFYVFGPLHPFVDPQDVTVYKKGYVAWNNKFIFPDYAHRKQSQDIYDQIRLDEFKSVYSHDKHVSFIRSCIHSAFVSHKKIKIRTSFEWEIDLALEEVKKR